MSKAKSNSKRSVMETTLDNLSLVKKAPVSGYVVLLVLYVLFSALVTASARIPGQIPIGDSAVSFSTFTGVVSAIANICIIFIVLYYRKLGLWTALISQFISIPMLLGAVFRLHSLSSLPGLFTSGVTILTILLLHANNNRLEKAQDYIRVQATTDMLTKLPNRFATSVLLRDMQQKGERFAVVSIDLNNFKSINDTLGFDAGNKVLIQIAERWKKIADERVAGTLDFIARLSGDEFALVIRDYHAEQDILNTIKHYEAALGGRLTVDDCDLYIDASFGYAFFPEDSDNVETLFSYAGTAMREVKRVNSSNRILRFTPELIHAEHIIEIERKLRTALENDTIYFNLQPQYDIDHKLRGFESLARMKDEDGNIISPGEFIPVAEKVGLVDKVDGAVFRKSAAFIGQNIQQTGSDVMLSVNVSVRHLMKNDFLDELREVLEKTGIPAHQLEIEITESIMIDSADKALQCIDEIKNMGVQIAIDDFGTGYSSLGYLNKFPANLLKIDKSFIDKMNTSDSSKQYVAAIISIGHIMGFEVISEGVEEEAQLDTLRDIGCDYIQGFIWGRPLPQEEAEKIVMASVAK